MSNSLQTALYHLNSGAPAKCISICNEILSANPGLIQAHYLRGCAAAETGDIALSVGDLEIVNSNNPEHLHAAYYLGRSLRRAGRLEEALVPLQAAVPDSELGVPARYELATCLTLLRRRPEAIDHYNEILKRQPDNAQVAANLAALLERENRLDEAENWADLALTLAPDNETAMMVRATLDRRAGKFEKAANGLRKLIKEIGNPINRSIAWNQLGQCLEGRGDWQEAFNAFSESNLELGRHHPDARPDPRGPHSLETLTRIRTWLTTNPMDDWNVPVMPDCGEIAFLVGFPRSGTTLLDHMLRAHPDIEVLEEKSLFSALHQDWSRPGTLEALADVSDAQITDARKSYCREMSRHRRQPERPLVIDKLPLNLAYLFLIYRLFPEAKIILLQRHPMDVCISCFSQAFELAASMAYFLDLQKTAEYYDAVMQVAAMSLDQIGNPLHRLHYEDLVTAPRSQLEALANFLELESNDSMLDFRQQSGGETSNTPSYQQVSRPLHSGSVAKWRHYAKQLESSQSYLQPWVKRLGYQEQDNVVV